MAAQAACNCCCCLAAAALSPLIHAAWPQTLPASLCLLCSEGPGYIAWGHSTAVGPFAEILGTTGAPSWGSLASRLLP